MKSWVYSNSYLPMCMEAPKKASCRGKVYGELGGFEPVDWSY